MHTSEMKVNQDIDHVTHGFFNGHIVTCSPSNQNKASRQRILPRKLLLSLVVKPS